VVVVVLMGVVVPQCYDDDIAIQYQNVGEPCDIEQQGLLKLCKNFLPCRSNELGNRSCVKSTEATYADFPYRQSCKTDNDCFTPQYCSPELICDYNSMPNGYSCEHDSQCASQLCIRQGKTGTCTMNNTIHDDEFSEGIILCQDDSYCPFGQFCSNEMKCHLPLDAGKDCTPYADSTKQYNTICHPGYACLPNNNNTFVCRELFVGDKGKYCGNSDYVCRYGLYCNPKTQLCANLPSYSDNSISCNSSDIGVCPNGFLCSCAGNVQNSNSTIKGICQSYLNPFFNNSWIKYLSCLKNSGCYYDPYTLLFNSESAFPSDFLGPLNRFSCAARHCTKEYNHVVKFQNEGFVKNRFSPSLIPTWSLAGDAVLKGWEIALITVGALTAGALIVGLMQFFKQRSSYEEIS